MSPITVNGRPLGVEVNGVFTAENTAIIPGGRLWSGNGHDAGAARAWNDARAAFIKAGGHPADFMPAGPVSSARTVAAQRYFYAHRPPPAAVPGTSNHGWGLAVDVKGPAAMAWLLRHGLKFGFSHDEGARVKEVWHYRYTGGYKPRSEGLAHLTRHERKLCRELDALRRKRADVPRRREIVRELTAQRKRVWRAAQQSGWDIRNRRERYRSLLARTT